MARDEERAARARSGPGRSAASCRAAAARSAGSGSMSVALAQTVERLERSASRPATTSSACAASSSAGIRGGHRHAAQTGRACRLQPPPRVLHRHGAAPVERRPVAVPSRANASRYGSGDGLAARGLVGPDHGQQRATQSGATQHLVDLVGQGAGGDGHRHGGRGLTDERRRRRGRTSRPGSPAPRSARALARQIVLDVSSSANVELADRRPASRSTPRSSNPRYSVEIRLVGQRAAHDAAQHFLEARAGAAARCRRSLRRSRG